MTTTPLASTRPDEGAQADEPGSFDTRLKALLLGRHWHSYGRFCRVYDRTAREIDPSWRAAYPTRTTLYRWTSGQMTRLPGEQHCEVLEAMFPGFTADELFEPAQPEDYQRVRSDGQPVTRPAVRPVAQGPAGAVVPGPVVEHWAPCAACAGYGVVRQRGVVPPDTGNAA